MTSPFDYEISKILTYLISVGVLADYHYEKECKVLDKSLREQGRQASLMQIARGKKESTTQAQDKVVNENYEDADFFTNYRIARLKGIKIVV